MACLQVTRHRLLRELHHDLTQLALEPVGQDLENISGEIMKIISGEIISMKIISLILMKIISLILMKIISGEIYENYFRWD